MPTDFRLVLVTVPEADRAEKIAIGLVESKLAACVTHIPQATSHYVWQDKLEKTTEILLLIKTKALMISSVIQFVKENHSAKVPEIISLPISEGDRAYLDWLGASVRFARPKEDTTLPT